MEYAVFYIINQNILPWIYDGMWGRLFMICKLMCFLA